MENKTINSKRILLRNIKEADVDSIFAYRSLEDVARYQYWEPFTKVQTIDFVNKNMNSPLNKKGEWIGLAIINKDDDKLIGDCSIKLNLNNAEIGCNISPEYQHRGFAKEVLELLINCYFNNSDLDEIFGITDSQNKASIKLMESVGMTRAIDFEEKLICKGILSIEHKYYLRKADRR